MQVLDGSRRSEKGQPTSIPPPSIHQRSVKTGVPGLKLLAYLRPEKPDETLNNSFRACAIRLPYLYALSENGTLWTFSLPSGERGPETRIVRPVSKLETKARDLITTGDALIASSTEHGSEVFSLEDPAHPRSIGSAGPGADNLLLHQERLLCLAVKYSPTNRTGVLTVFDISNSRRPVILSVTNIPQFPVSGCIISNHLYLQLGDEKRRARHEAFGSTDQGEIIYSIANFDFSPEGVLNYHSQVACPSWCPWLIPFDKEIVAVNDSESIRLSVTNPVAPLFLEKRLSARSRSAVGADRNGESFLFLNGAVWKRTADGWILCGRIPTANQGDGSPYRAASQGPYLAIPTDDQVWLYEWTNISSPAEKRP